MTSNTVPVGQRIRDLRISRGMTQEKLARMSGVDIKTIYRAESGAAAMRPETLLDIATALEVPLDDIRGRLADDQPVVESSTGNAETEGHGNLVLRRVERASSFYHLARGCERYSWSFHVDPDEETAGFISEFMRIAKRAIEGPAAGGDEYDEQGEFSEPARVARLKMLIESLRGVDVSVLCNKFIHYQPDDNRGGAAAVLRVVFVEGDVKRRKEYADFPLAREENGTMTERSNVIDGIGNLDFDECGNSVMGALALALDEIGDPAPYDFLMGASGAAFRLQMALPAWCPSAPYAGVGFDCIPLAATAIGRTIEWISPEQGAPNPMQRRVAAIIESIDRGIPVLYGAEECGLIVGYHKGGEQFSLRTYFDAAEMYAVLDQLNWPSPGIIGEKKDAPDPQDVLRCSLDVALELAHCTEHFATHHPGRYYACGFEAWEAWIAGLRDDDHFEALAQAERAVPMQANSWCYQSLIDARGAASRYLEGCARERDGEIASRLERAAALYGEQRALLAAGHQHVPHPGMQANDDLVGVGYRLKGGDPWSADARHAQAETLDQALALERKATLQLERAREEL